MKWTAGNVSVAHAREGWDLGFNEPVQVHCRLDQLNGNWGRYTRLDKKSITRKYAAAKFRFDVEAAFDLIDRCWNSAAFDRIVAAVMDCDLEPRIIFPHLPFDDVDAVGHQPRIRRRPTNALPFAFARVLARRLDCEIEDTIVQSSRVGRTNLGRWMRFLCQPSFHGRVATNHAYVIVDDVFTTGGTLAGLRSYDGWNACRTA